MSNERNHTDPDRLLKYLAGELSERERYELERQLEKDPFAREALEGLEAVGADKAREDLLSLHQSLRKRLGRRRRIAIYGMAAAIASLLIVGSLFLQLYDFHPSQEEQEMNYPRKEAVPLSEPQVQPESSVAG
jgi:ferric-dicitrate binding protein FerR (iron transport regulator)